MGETYYLSINSANLGSYFSRGCVSPAKYITNRQQDIQSKFNNGLLLSEKKLIAGENCCLELVLTNSERRLLIPLDMGAYILGAPLPITRVKNIIFMHQKQRDETLWNINDGAAFVPESLTKIEVNPGSIDVDVLLNAKYPELTTDWTDTLEVYDRFLGCFAFMKNSGNKEWEYSENYFQTISHINLLIAKELKMSSMHFTNLYSKIFTDRNATRNKYSYVKLEDVEKQARVEGIRIEKSLGSIMLENIDPLSEAYSLALLYSYGLNARKTIDDFINYFQAGNIPAEKSEKIAMLFGYNTGYKAFRNRYKTVKFAIDVKYHLDSQVDYYTIESIFQYVVNEKRDNSSYEYLDIWCPKLNPKVVQKGLNTYRMLDKTIIHSIKPKLGSKEYLDALFQKASATALYKKIVSILSQHFPDFVSVDDDRAMAQVEQQISSPMRTIVQNIFEASRKDLKAEYDTKIQALINENTAMSELLKAEESKGALLQKEHIELKDSLMKLDKTSDISVDKSKVSSEIPPSESKPESNDRKGNTSPTQDDIPTYDTVSDEELELLNMGLGKLKEIAKELGIKRLTTYNLKNKVGLISEIMIAKRSDNPFKFSGNSK